MDLIPKGLYVARGVMRTDPHSHVSTMAGQQQLVIFVGICSR